MDSMIARRRVRSVLAILASLSPLLVLLILLSPAAPVQADNAVVGNGIDASSCNMFTLGHAMTVNITGTITFACGGPATIVLTQSGGLNVNSGQALTIDGGGIITITGNDAFSLFWVHAGGTLTLTHMVLGHGAPVNGSCLFADGSLVLTVVEVYHCQTGIGDSGGAVYVNSSGSAVLTGANLHDNNADTGAGIYSLGHVEVYNSQLAFNHAATGDGGGIWLTGTATIQDSTFFDNTAPHFNRLGGAIFSQGQLSVQNSSFTDNLADGGGGAMQIDQGGAFLANLSLTGNLGFRGGAVHMGPSTLVSLFHSELSHNQASFGGAIYNEGKNLSLFSNHFEQNSAFFTGGAVYNSGSLSFYNSTLEGNTANVGGAFYNDTGGSFLDDSDTFVGNSATFDGGAINNSSTLSSHSSNTTISGNSAGGDGGGLYNLGTLSLTDLTIANNRAGGTGGAVFQVNVLYLIDSILAYSPHGGNCGGSAVTSSTYSISSDLTCNLSGTVHNNISVNGLDPRLTALGNYGGATRVHMLEHNSPAIDGVLGLGPLLIDQRGLDRPALGGYDIGAVERQPTDSDLAPRIWLPLTRR